MGFALCKSESAVSCCPLETICLDSDESGDLRVEKPVKIRRFQLIDLESATGGFSKTNFLGKGSHGAVYKGTLKDGRLVAVKKQATLRDETAFENELEILTKIRCNQIVNLVGFCMDSLTQERVLVVEFMAYGTLSDILHCCPEPLSLSMRAHLAYQAAKAVKALHAASPPIIHRDIKSGNILIDGTWNAKLGDFGLAIRGYLEDVLRSDLVPAGTLGYIDPQYVERPSTFSSKSDVYSFGVLLFELITGREAIDARYRPPTILDWALPLVKQKKFVALCDPKMQISVQEMKGLEQLTMIASRCVRRTVEKRPAMTEVAANLRRICKSIPLPKWIGLARVMKAPLQHVGPQLPASREFAYLWNGGAEAARVRGLQTSDTNSREHSKELAIKVASTNKGEDLMMSQELTETNMQNSARERDGDRESTVWQSWSGSLTKEPDLMYTADNPITPQAWFQNEVKRELENVRHAQLRDNLMSLREKYSTSSEHPQHPTGMKRQESFDNLREGIKGRSKDMSPVRKAAGSQSERSKNHLKGGHARSRSLSADSWDTSDSLVKESPKGVVDACIASYRKWRNTDYDNPNKSPFRLTKAAEALKLSKHSSNVEPSTELAWTPRRTSTELNTYQSTSDDPRLLINSRGSQSARYIIDYRGNYASDMDGLTPVHKQYSDAETASGFTKHHTDADTGIPYHKITHYPDLDIAHHKLLGYPDVDTLGSKPSSRAGSRPSSRSGSKRYTEADILDILESHGVILTKASWSRQNSSRNLNYKGDRPGYTDADAYGAPRPSWSRTCSGKGSKGPGFIEPDTPRKSVSRPVSRTNSGRGGKGAGFIIDLLKQL